MYITTEFNKTTKSTFSVAPQTQVLGRDIKFS